MPVPDRKRRLTTFVVAMAVLIATPLAVVATDSFTDVPDSNVHHDNITWLSDTGVTAGCNPPDNDEYCPDENVTRAQMATFIRRLSENEIVNAATANEADHAADADTVGGLTPAQIAYGFADTGPNTTGTVDGEAKLEEITVEVPEDGYLQITGSTSFIDTNGGTLLMWLQFDNTTCDNTVDNIISVGFGYGSTAGIPTNSAGSGAFGEGTIAAAAGSHTITLCGNYYLGGPGSLYGPSISALFVKNATVTAGLHSADLPADLPGSK